MDITVTLITGRTAEQGIGKEIGKPSERYWSSANCIMLNPLDAEKIGVQDGGSVEVSTLHGSIILYCRLSKEVEEGIAFMPLGPWANRLLDFKTFGTGIPSVKGVEAKVRRVEGEPPTLEDLLREMRGE